MLELNCNWCSSKGSIDKSSVEDEFAEKYICANCLIPILPHTLNTKEDSAYLDDKSDNNRKHRRYPLLSHSYLSTQSNQSKFTRIIILDISSSGMRCQIPDPIKTDSNITIGFLGDHLIYKALGKVKHVSEVEKGDKLTYQAGIELTGIHQELRKS